MRLRQAEAVAKVDNAIDTTKKADEVLRLTRANKEGVDKVVQSKANEVQITREHLASLPLSNNQR